MKMEMEDRLAGGETLVESDVETVRVETLDIAAWPDR